MLTTKINNYIINILVATFLINNLSNPGSENDNRNFTKTDNFEDSFIEWNEELKLLKSDFQAEYKETDGDAVATTASAFGYSITDDNGNITGNIYVRFYPGKSWWNPEFKEVEKFKEVLEHEQLHFDICELYGRKLYKGIISLRNKRRLNEYQINKLMSKLEKQYINFQDQYDKDTDHSINQKEQERWNNLIRNELNSMKWYSNYHSF